jgi:hypothetical protein
MIFQLSGGGLTLYLDSYGTDIITNCILNSYKILIDMKKSLQMKTPISIESSPNVIEQIRNICAYIKSNFINGNKQSIENIIKYLIAQKKPDGNNLTIDEILTFLSVYMNITKQIIQLIVNTLPPTYTLSSPTSQPFATPNVPIVFSTESLENNTFASSTGHTPNYELINEIIQEGKQSNRFYKDIVEDLYNLLSHDQLNIDNYEKVLNKNIGLNILINVFFKINGIDIPEEIIIPDIIKDTNTITTFIGENSEKLTKSQIINNLLEEDLPIQIIQDVYAALDLLGKNNYTQNTPPTKKKPYTAVIQVVEEGDAVEGNDQSAIIWSPGSTLLLRGVFGCNQYKGMLNMLYQNCPNSKEVIKQSLKESTMIDVSPEETKTMSTAAYDKLVGDLVVWKNDAGGNCFFTSVAQAINQYNKTNEDQRIIYQSINPRNKGLMLGEGNNSFNQLELRYIMLDYYNKNPREIESVYHSIDIGVFQGIVDELNRDFEKAIKHTITLGHKINTKEYFAQVTNIFGPSGKFLISTFYLLNNIIQPNPSDPNYLKPFVIVQREQFKHYILTRDFWGNELAINVLREQLSLEIVPLTITGNRLKPSFADKKYKITSEVNNFANIKWNLN